MPAADDRPHTWRRRRAFLIAALAGLAVFAVLAVLVKTGAFDHLDARVVNLFADRRRQPFTDIAEVLDSLSAPWLLATIVVVLVGGLWWSGRMVQAVYLAATIVVAVSLNPLLKLAFGRERPPDQAVSTITGYSFPSGHTTTTAAIAVALAVVFWSTRRRWPLLVGAAAFSVVMAVSRVCLAVHWPSDVLAGLALGFTIAMAVRAVMPWPSPEATAARQDETAATGRGRPAAGDGDGRPDIAVVFLDWGNTLMVDNGMREGPMKDWAVVEAEAGAQEALQRLRARYRLVVATNAEESPALFVRLALARVGLDDLIDDIVSSADVGDHKPNYPFFRAALLREGKGGVPLDPRRAVMVGDGTTNDIAGAQRAGMRTIWYNPTKRRFPVGAQRPDAVIRRLSELPAAVDRLAGVQPSRRSRERRDSEAASAAAAEAAVRDLRAETAAEDAAASAAAAIPGGAPMGAGPSLLVTPADAGAVDGQTGTPPTSVEAS